MACLLIMNVPPSRFAHLDKVWLCILYGCREGFFVFPFDQRHRMCPSLAKARQCRLQIVQQLPLLVGFAGWLKLLQFLVDRSSVVIDILVKLLLKLRIFGSDVAIENDDILSRCGIDACDVQDARTESSLISSTPAAIDCSLTNEKAPYPAVIDSMPRMTNSLADCQTHGNTPAFSLCCIQEDESLMQMVRSETPPAQVFANATQLTQAG